MPEVIGYSKYHSDNPNATVAEEDFEIASLRMKNKGKIRGKNVYGFFVTDEEWKEKVSEAVCSDGWFEVPLVAHKKEEAIPIGPLSAPVNNREVERIADKNNEENFVGTEAWMKKELIGLDIPARKIRFWHKLGWAFKG